MTRLFLLLFVSCFFSTISQGQGVHQEILANWQKPVYNDLAQQYQNEDAVILFNRTYQTYYSIVNDRIRSVIPVKSWHRKIKINTLNGLENFSTIYIPLFEDVMEEAMIVDIKGRTIKKNGEVHEIKSDFIKETTLPANVPFLYGYSGKVKQFVFQNIEIGDQIEYYYAITYRYGYLSTNFSPHGTIPIHTSYPTLESKFAFYTDKNINLHYVTENCRYAFVKNDFDKNKWHYDLTISNPPLSKSELFDNNNYSEGQIKFFLHYTTNAPIDTWDAFLKSEKSKVKASSTLSTHKSLDEIADLAKKGTSIDEKVQLAITHINEPLEKDTLKLYRALRFANRVDYYEGQQYTLMLKKMGIPAKIVLVKNKTLGPLNIENVYGQFDDLLVEYISENGKPHYIAPLKPHSYIDDISYLYQNTKALRVDPTSNQIDFITLPDFSEKNTYTVRNKVNVTPSTQNKVTVKVDKDIVQNGAFEQISRYDFIRELKDTTFQGFSDYEKKRLKKNFSNVKIHSLTLNNAQKNHVQWNTNYEYTIASGISNNSMVLPLDELLETNYKLDISDRTNRTKNAYLKYGNTRKYYFTIRLPEGYQIIDNKFLKNQYKNEVGSFSSSYKITTPNTIELEYSITLPKEVISVQEWPLLVELFDKAYAFHAQKIYSLKK